MKLEIETCQDCGFSRAQPEPSNSELEEYYEKEYRSKGSPFFIDFADLEQGRSTSYLDMRSIAQISLATMYVDFEPGDVFLDLGPGVGASFSSARRILESPSLHAIELADGAAHFYAEAYGAVTHTLESFAAGAERAQIALLSHSLEHYPASQLHKVLEVLHSCVSEKGALVIEVPNDDFRNHAEVNRPQTPHLSFFTLKSLSQLVGESGWRVEFAAPCVSRKRPMDFENGVSETSVQLRYRDLLRGAWSKSPRIVRRGYRAIRAARREFRGSNEFESLLNLHYGSERDCLRLVATHSGCEAGDVPHP